MRSPFVHVEGILVFSGRPLRGSALGIRLFFAFVQSSASWQEFMEFGFFFCIAFAEIAGLQVELVGRKLAFPM